MLYDKLLLLRKKHGGSQQEIADLLSVSRQTISNWETGQGAPSIDKAIELSILYKINLNDLVEDKIDIIVQSKKNEMKKTSVILKKFVGRICKIELSICDIEKSGIYESSVDNCTIIDVSDEWIKVDYPVKNFLKQKEMHLRLIEIDSIVAITIKEAI